MDDAFDSFWVYINSLERPAQGVSCERPAQGVTYSFLFIAYQISALEVEAGWTTPFDSFQMYINSLERPAKGVSLERRGEFF